MESSDLGSQREKDVEVSCEAAHRKDLDVVDNVQTPIAHKKENLVEGFESKTPNQMLGMRFETEEQAYQFYNEYARKSGFGIRRDYAHKIKDGIVKRRRFSCSSGGHRKERKRGAIVKRHRDSIRTGCMAHIIVALQWDGTYAIAKFEDTHNHQCTPKKTHMFRSQKQTKAEFESELADSSGMSPKAEFDFLSDEAGGSEIVEFLSMDYDNCLRSKRMRSMAEGDARDVLHYLQEMLVKDPGSFYTVQLDEDDKISNIFWADSNMVIDYHIFGDLVCFDTTYRTNNYGRPFASFFGVNHHNQIVVFGAALIYDETSPSFQWLFKAFLDAMSGKKPTTILTDQDKEMENAISVVMSNAYHRICIWHIYQNAMKHLNSVFNSYKSFAVDFGKCIYEYEEEVDFLDAWERMLEKYSLQENVWLQHLFDEREKWALVYRKNTFCANMKSTQQSEAMNTVIRWYLHHSHSLLEFFSQFERVVFDMRKAESEADFKMIQGTPVFWINVPILIGARNMYTPEIFKLFQEEFENGMNCTATIHCTVGTITTYKVHSLKKNRDNTVTFDSLQKTIECCCKKFEFSGILCGHALKVLVCADLVEVPDRYILKRWRKDAKFSTINISSFPASEDRRARSTRYRELMHNIKKLSNKAALTPEAYLLAMDGIMNTMEKLEHLHIHPSCTSTSQCMGAKPSREYAELDILDVDENIKRTSSVSTQVKGVKRKEKGLKDEKRKKSALEKVINRKLSSNAGPLTDSACSPINLTTSTHSSDHHSQALLPTLPMDQPSGNQHTNLQRYPHMLAYQMNPCMNHQDQHHLTTSHTSQVLHHQKRELGDLHGFRETFSTIFLDKGYLMLMEERVFSFVKLIKQARLTPAWTDECQLVYEYIPLHFEAFQLGMAPMSIGILPVYG